MQKRGAASDTALERYFGQLAQQAAEDLAQTSLDVVLPDEREPERLEMCGDCATRLNEVSLCICGVVGGENLSPWQPV